MVGNGYLYLSFCTKLLLNVIHYDATGVCSHRIFGTLDIHKRTKMVDFAFGSLFVLFYTLIFIDPAPFCILGLRFYEKCKDYRSWLCDFLGNIMDIPRYIE